MQPDLVILVSSVLVTGGKSILKIGHLVLQLGNSSVGLGKLLVKGILLLLLRLDPLLDILHLLLDLGTHILNADSLVDDLLRADAGIGGVAAATVPNSGIVICQSDKSSSK